MFYNWLVDLMEALKTPGEEFTNHACVVREDLRRESLANFAQFQKKVIAIARDNGELSLHTLLMGPLKK